MSHYSTSEAPTRSTQECSANSRAAPPPQPRSAQVEDDHANGARLAGAKTILSSVNDTPVPLSTCHASYTIDGKAGSELLEVHERRDYYENNGRFKAVPAPHLSGHGADPTNTYKATVSGLAYQEPQLEARRLQTYLWSGSKFNDAGVPHDVNTMHPPRKTIMNRVDAVDNREFAGNTLQATASSGPEAASLLASSKRGLIYPQCPGG